MKNVLPLPDSSTRHMTDAGKPTKDFTNWLKSIADYLNKDPVLVSQLPSAATVGVGARRFVTDASATLAASIGTTVTGGGANKVPVYSDGVNWRYG